MLGVRNEEAKENCSTTDFSVIVYLLNRRSLASSLHLWMSSGHPSYSIVQEASVFHKVSMPAVNVPVSHSTHGPFVREREQRLILNFEARDPKTLIPPLEGKKWVFHTKNVISLSVISLRGHSKASFNRKKELIAHSFSPSRFQRNSGMFKGRAVQMHKSRKDLSMSKTELLTSTILEGPRTVQFCDGKGIWQDSIATLESCALLWWQRGAHWF